MSKASTLNEAQAIVKALKTPSDVAIKINEFSKKIQSNRSSTSDKSSLLGTLISELLNLFPNAMPEKLLFDKIKDFDIEDQFLQNILDQFQELGYLLRNKDAQGNRVLKFLNTPFTIGKITILKPKLISE